MASCARELAIRHELEALEAMLAQHARHREVMQRHLSGLCTAVATAVSGVLDARQVSIDRHSRDVMTWAVKVAEELGLREPDVEAVRFAALLHDVGKVGVSASVLNKPGPLDETEWDAVRRHPEVAQRLLAGLPIPVATIDAIRHHHERFDGRGYPDGLAGEAIPLGARIIAVADAFNAMTSDRPYRRRLDAGLARLEIIRCVRSHFCPRVVAAFLCVSARELGGAFAA